MMWQQRNRWEHLGPAVYAAKASGAHRRAAHGGARAEKEAEDEEEEEWRWGDYVTLHDGSLRVSLAGAGVRDVDLASLCAFLLRTWEERYVKCFPNGCDLTMDLSCNIGISDFGIVSHLVPFLRSWPTCSRLKLYRTSIGDRALEALTSWIAKGHARELHLSDLNAQVSPGTILSLLRAIHRGGQYPYWKHAGSRAPLWLRLEHNNLPHPDELVAQARAEGASIRILSKPELSTIRPGDDLRRHHGYGQDGFSPEVILVLFRMQHRKEFVQDECVEQTRDLISLLGGGGGPGGAGGLVGGLGGAIRKSEPQPLSVDEFRLWEMEVREAQECGANDHNFETFGNDVTLGWSFEENLAANARLRRGGAAAVSTRATAAAARADAAARAGDAVSAAAAAAAAAAEAAGGSFLATGRRRRRGGGALAVEAAANAAAAAAAAAWADSEHMVYAGDGYAHPGYAGDCYAGDNGYGGGACYMEDFGYGADGGWVPGGGGGGRNGGGGGGAGAAAYEAQTDSTASSSSAAPQGAGKAQAVKSEIEDAISLALKLIPLLDRSDFDGQVKQYLHAIRTKGGHQRVLDAIEVLRGATEGKTRNSVMRWPAYLVALLKRYLTQVTSSGGDGEKNKVRRDPKVVMPLVQASDGTYGSVVEIGGGGPMLDNGSNGSSDNNAGEARALSAEITSHFGLLQ